MYGYSIAWSKRAVSNLI